ncbi:MAG TPA: NAD-dependent epimerase/dehydratase family protein [Anaerolineae bacterium]|nr:NAD-dependent epimerase/dehydratase family protein [Anaerolineae bacterium]
MRVLVTGGAGFIGSHTVDLLLEKGYEVRILDSLQPRVHPRGKPSWVPPEAEFLHGDVANRADLAQALEGVDYVVHLAAYQDYMPDFATFIHTNAESTALIFELIVAAALAGRPLRVRKIVLASSQAVSGEGLYHCPEHGLMTPPSRPVAQLQRGDWELHCPHCAQAMAPQLIPETTVSPGTAYAISKYAIELLADRLGRRYGIPTACMRYTYVQGTRNSFYNAYSGVARIFCLRLLHGLPLVCYEDGHQLRDYVNVRDVARANVLVMEDERADFGVFNVGGKRPVTVLEFARIMIAEFGAAAAGLDPLLPGEFRLGDTRHTVSDVSRLEALGWQPTIPVEQNVHEYVEWMHRQQTTSEFLAEAERVMRDQGVIRRVTDAT